MLEQKTVHMTGEEIDDYYRRQEKENLKRYYAIQANRVLREDRIRLARLVFLTVLSLVVCTIFLKLHFQVQQQTYRVSLLQKEIEELRQENADAEKRIEDTVNLTVIWEKAQALGMGYPQEGNVIYYSVEESDYMNQMEDIPGQ